MLPHYSCITACTHRHLGQLRSLISIFNQFSYTPATTHDVAINPNIVVYSIVLIPHRYSVTVRIHCNLGIPHKI